MPATTTLPDAGFAYRARLRAPDMLAELAEHARLRGELRGWLIADAEPWHLGAATLIGLDGATSERRDVRGTGLWVNAHYAADDLCLVFDATSGELVDPSRARGGNGVPTVLGFGAVRTTWSSALTHVALLDFLEELAERDLASVELADASGLTLARDLKAATARIEGARSAQFAAMREHPDLPVKLRGVVELLAPAEAARRSDAGTGVLDLIPADERDGLLATRRRLIEAWSEAAPGLDGRPEAALPALEHLTDLLLSHPRYRHNPEYMLESFAWEAGVTLGFLLIESLGGHWERVESASGPYLRVANLMDTGLIWRPLASVRQRLSQGPLYAHDAVARWLQEIGATARAVLLA